MQTVIIIIHLMIVISLVVVILLQRSEGGALGIGGGGGGGFMSGRAQANALTRATAILAGLFFVTSIGLALLANNSRSARSIFDTGAPASHNAPGAPPAPQVPTKGGILPMLRQPAGSTAGQPVTQVPVSPSAPSHTAPATKPPAPANPATPAGPQVPTSH